MSRIFLIILLFAGISCHNPQAEPAVADNIAVFTISGMSCEVGCAAKIQKELNLLSGVANADVNFEVNQARVSFDIDKVSAEAILEKVHSIGDHRYETSDLKVIPLDQPPVKEGHGPKSKKNGTTEEVRFTPVVFPDIFRNPAKYF